MRNVFERLRRSLASPGAPQIPAQGWDRSGLWRHAEVGPHALTSGGQEGGAPLVADRGDEAQAAPDLGILVRSEARRHDVAGVGNLAAQTRWVARQSQADGPAREAGSAWRRGPGG